MASFKNNIFADVTTETTVLTAAATTTVIGMSIANTTATAITASVKMTVGASTIFIIKDAVIDPGGALIPVGGEQKVVLELNDSLKVVASGTADVLVSFLEM